MEDDTTVITRRITRRPKKKHFGMRIARAATAGAGALIAASGAMAFNDPFGVVATAGLGSVYQSVWDDVLQRQLSPAQKSRVERALEVAWEMIENQQQQGGTPRPEFSDGELKEFGGAVLLAARDSYEEKKVPFIGTLVGTAPYTALPVPNLIEGLRLAESMTYRQLCLISIYGEKYYSEATGHQSKYTLSTVPLRQQKDKYYDEYAMGVYGDIECLMANRLLAQRVPEVPDWSTGRSIGISSGAVTDDIVPFLVMARFKAQWLFNGMRLSNVPQEDLDPIITALE